MVKKHNPIIGGECCYLTPPSGLIRAKAVSKDDGLGTLTDEVDIITLYDTTCHRSRVLITEILGNTNSPIV
jgi:hypothetical protein